MKKLTMLAIAVFSAVALNAATVSWSVSKIQKTDDTATRANGIAYFVTTAAFGAASDFTSTYGGKGATALSSALASAYSFSVSGGAFDNSAAPVENATLGLSDATAYTGYLVVFDTATITDASTFYVSSTADFETYGGTANKSITFGSQKALSTAATWGTVASSTPTPEPTSGLLLLLGMAGLALKRKNA